MSILTVLPYHVDAPVSKLGDALQITLDQHRIRQQIAPEDRVVRILHEVPEKTLHDLGRIIGITALLRVSDRKDNKVITIG